MRTLLVARNNIKKAKGTTAVLFFLIVFATVLLYTAASVFLQSKTYVSDMVEKLNSADYIYVVEDKYKEDAVRIIEKMDQVIDYEASDIVSCLTVDIDNKQVDGMNRPCHPTFVHIIAGNSIASQCSQENTGKAYRTESMFLLE